MSEIEEQPYREMVEAQDDAQIDRWAADLFIDFAKRLGVGQAIAGLRRIDPKARQALVRFLVQHREVMSYTA